MKPERIIEINGMMVDLDMVGTVDKCLLGDQGDYYFTISIGNLKERMVSHNSQYNAAPCNEMRNFFIKKWKAFKEWQYKTIDERVADALLNGTNNGTN